MFRLSRYLLRKEYWSLLPALLQDPELLMIQVRVRVVLPPKLIFVLLFKVMGAVIVSASRRYLNGRCTGCTIQYDARVADWIDRIRSSPVEKQLAQEFAVCGPPTEVASKTLECEVVPNSAESFTLPATPGTDEPDQLEAFPQNLSVPESPVQMPGIPPKDITTSVCE